jgi:murein hydrolase activator
MRRPSPRACRTAVGAVAALCLGLSGGPLLAQEPEDRELLESQRRLEMIRAERDDLRNEMTRIRTRVSDLSSEVSNLDRQVGAAAGLLGELEFQLEQRELQIQRNTYELLMTRDRLAERRAVLYRRLRDIHKRGAMPTMQVLLAAENFSDLLNRYRYLHLIAQHDRRLAEEVAELERQLVARERALRSNLAQLESVRMERAQEFGNLTALQDRQRAALTNVRSRESATALRIDQLERDEVRLAGLLGEFERRRREEEFAAAGGTTTGAAPGVETFASDRMGTLDWPLEGSVLYGFGRVTQPNGTAVRWNGIGIGAPPGTAVHAVEDGTVALAGPFEGYGPTVIVSHGGGYYTLYLYLRAVGVSEGDIVRRGQRIGSVGGETATEAPHMEFQVRVPGGQAVDPLPWLRTRG